MFHQTKKITDTITLLIVFAASILPFPCRSHDQNFLHGFTMQDIAKKTGQEIKIFNCDYNESLFLDRRTSHSR